MKKASNILTISNKILNRFNSIKPLIFFFHWFKHCYFKPVNHFINSKDIVVQILDALCPLNPVFPGKYVLGRCPCPAGDDVLLECEVESCLQA